MATPGKGKTRFEFDRQFQEDIVKALYQDQNFALGSLDKLDPDYFEEPHHRWMAKTIYWCHKTLGAAPTISVLLNEATKAITVGIIKDEHAPLVTKLLKGLKKPVANKSYIISEVTNFAQTQAWKSAILKAVDEHLPSGNYGDLRKEMMEVAEMNFANDGGIGSFFFEGAEKRQKAREKAKVKVIPTGTKLDAYTKHGGLPLKTTAMVVATTGKGKTNWLIDRTVVALTEVEDLQAVYYTFELPTEMIEERFDARVTDIPIQLLNSAGQAYREKMEEMKALFGGRLIVKEYPAGEITSHTLKSHIRSLERFAFYPKLIVVDYAELMMPTIITTDALANEARVFLDLDGLAKHEEALVWTANQGNRKAMEDEVETTTMAHQQGSIKKSQSAYFVVTLSQTLEEKKKDRMRANIEKNRFGAAGVEIQLKVDHSRGIFKDAA